MRTINLFALVAVVLSLQACAHGHRHCMGSHAGVGGTDGVTVTGVGEAEAVPDRAHFQMGVEVRRPTADEARETSARAQQAVLDALRQSGIESRDIRTTHLQVMPDYDYSERGRKFLGYVVTNQVHVQSRALDKLGQTMDAALSAGGEMVRLDGVSFEVSDPVPVKRKARELAVANARAEAEHVTSLLNAALESVVSVEESSAHPPGPMAMRMDAAALKSTPVEAGTTRVRVEVRVRWSLRAR